MILDEKGRLQLQVKDILELESDKVESNRSAARRIKVKYFGIIYLTIDASLVPTDDCNVVDRAVPEILPKGADYSWSYADKEIGKVIRRWRRKRRLTQTKLAERAGISQSHLARLETEKHTPSHITIRKLAKALRIRPTLLDIRIDD